MLTAFWLNPSLTTDQEIAIIIPYSMNNNIFILSNMELYG